MNEQDAMWETFDTLIPEESWVPSDEEKWLIDKIAQAKEKLDVLDEFEPERGDKL